MSDLIGPLLPGGNILVQPLGHGTVRPLGCGTMSFIPTAEQAKSLVYSSDTKLMLTSLEAVSDNKPLSWRVGVAIGGPRDGVQFGSYRNEIAFSMNCYGWTVNYMWDGVGSWIYKSKAVSDPRLMSDPPVGEELPSGRNPAPADPVRDHVDAVIQDLSGRKVSAPDRARLRGAVDKADAPLAGREGADSALGRAIGKPAAFSMECLS